MFDDEPVAEYDDNFIPTSEKIDNVLNEGLEESNEPEIVRSNDISIQQLKQLHDMINDVSKRKRKSKRVVQDLRIEQSSILARSDLNQELDSDILNSIDIQSLKAIDASNKHNHKNINNTVVIDNSTVKTIPIKKVYVTCVRFVLLHNIWLC